MAKPKFGFYWCSSCGGCEEAIVDLNAKILDVAEKVDIVFWPCAMDFKYDDVHKMKDGELTAVFINGAIRSSEQLEMAQLLRQKAQYVIAFGACSQIGGIPGLANFWDRDSIFESSYGSACPSIDNPDGTRPQVKSQVPEGELELPKFHNTVKSLDQVVEVDYYIPGCSPAPYLTMRAMEAILEDKLPEKGSVLAPNVALCEQCSRKDSKPDKLVMRDIQRISLVDADPERCFLDQGILCMGPVTRAGCTADGEGRCVRVNMPCRGCYGPTSEILDVGAKMTAALGTILGIENEENVKQEEVETLLDKLVDPAGYFYRFSLPVSILQRKQME